jgi:hypothetical protein
MMFGMWTFGKGSPPKRPEVLIETGFRPDVASLVSKHFHNWIPRPLLMRMNG